MRFYKLILTYGTTDEVCNNPKDDFVKNLIDMTR